MHRIDNSVFLLYIEPKREEKLKEPVNDELTSLMEMELKKSIKGSADYTGSMEKNLEIGVFKKLDKKTKQNFIDTGFFHAGGGGYKG